MRTGIPTVRMMKRSAVHCPHGARAGGMAGLEPATCWVVVPVSEINRPALPSSLPHCQLCYTPMLAGKAIIPAVAGLSRLSSICP